MYLLELSISQFGQVLQMVLWISLPFTIVCLAITTFLHYRRKRKNTKLEDPLMEAELGLLPGAYQPVLGLQASETMRYPRGDREQLYKEWQQLEAETRQLKEELAQQAKEKEEQANEINRLDNILQNLEATATAAGKETEQAEEAFQQQLEIAGKEYLFEKKKLAEQLEQLKLDLESLHQENIALQDQLLNNNEPIEPAGNETLQQLQMAVVQSELEKTELKNKLAESGYLNDVLHEKRLQIEFLQNQLEQRIKTNHQAEQQYIELSGQKEQLQQTLDHVHQQVSALEETLQLKQQEAGDRQGKINEQEKEMQQLNTEILLKTTEIHRLENDLSELQKENASLYESVADHSHQFGLLEEKLAAAQSEAKRFEERWEQSSRLISRIYRELAGSFEGDIALSQAASLVQQNKKETILV